MYSSDLQILQPPGHVVFLAGFNHSYRVVPLDGRPHLPENVKLFMGDSRGRWEGNTLIVDVTNNNDKTWLDVIGSFHSDALHVVERFTVVDARTINYEATIEDPKVYTRPWKLALVLERIHERTLSSGKRRVSKENATCPTSSAAAKRVSAAFGPPSPARPRAFPIAPNQERHKSRHKIRKFEYSFRVACLV